MTRDVRIALSFRMPTHDRPATIVTGDIAAEGWVLVSNDMTPEHREALEEFGQIEITLCDSMSHAAAICGAIDHLDLVDVKTGFSQLQDGDGIALVTFPDGESGITFRDGRVIGRTLADLERIAMSWEMTASDYRGLGARGYGIGDRLARTIVEMLATAGNLDAVHGVQHQVQDIPGADIMVITTSVGDQEDDMLREFSDEDYIRAHAVVRKVVDEISLDSAKALVSERVIDELRAVAPDLFAAEDRPGPSDM